MEEMVRSRPVLTSMTLKRGLFSFYLIILAASSALTLIDLRYKLIFKMTYMIIEVVKITTNVRISLADK